jgi:chromate transport protein ChrA
VGLTSFGGPIDHIGYFRREFVKRCRWLDEETFTDLVGFSVGLVRIYAALRPVIARSPA